MSRIRRFSTLYKRKNLILNGELITQILSSISYLNGQLNNSNQEQLNKIQISTLNIGLINSICSIISKIVENNNSIMHLIMDSEIPYQLIRLINLTPLNQIRLVHFNSLSIIIKQCSNYYRQQLYNHDTVQILSLILTHHSSQCIENTVISLYQIIKAGSFLTSQNSDCSLQLPSQYQHPYLTELQKIGIIEQIENCVISQQSNKEISLILSKLFCQLYRGFDISLQIKQIVIQSINIKIEDNLIQNKDICDELDHLALLSQNKENIDSILVNNSVQIINEYKFKFNFKIIQRIIQIYSNVYENGNEIIRQYIKDFQPLDFIEILVNRNNQSHLYYIENNEMQKQRSETAYQQMNFNKFVFKLLAQFKEQEKMNQLKILNNSIYVEQINHLNDDTENNTEIEIIKNGENVNELNNWENIEKMLQIVKSMNDKELAEGAMLIVSEAAYSILFKCLLNQDSEFTLTSMTAFQKIINEIDNFILQNFIDENLIRLISFIIEDKIQQDNYLLIKEKAFILLSNISFRGSIMTSDFDINYFQRIFDNQNINIILIKEIQDKTQQRIQNSQKYITQKNIKLHAVICLGCQKNKKINNNLILNQMIKIFHDKINSFKSNIEQQYIQSTEEIELVRQMLISYSHFCDNIDNLEELDLSFSNNNLMSIIHINCNCFYSIEFDKSSSISNLISVVYFTLSRFICQYSKRTFLDHESDDGTISHVSQFIRKQLNQINLNSESLNSHQCIAENLGLVQYFLSSLINQDTDTALSSILSEPDLLQNTVNLISNDEIIMISDYEKNLLKFRCLKFIQQFNQIYKHSDSWELFQKLQMKEQFTKLLCCAGGDGNDNDNVESICAEILIDILSNQIQLNKMLTIIEEDGLIEEVDDLNFHSDSRRKVGVLKKGFDLKQEIIGSSLIYEKDEFDDQYQSDEEAD